MQNVFEVCERTKYLLNWSDLRRSSHSDRFLGRSLYFVSNNKGSGLYFPLLYPLHLLSIVMFAIGSGSQIVGVLANLKDVWKAEG